MPPALSIPPEAGQVSGMTESPTATLPAPRPENSGPAITRIDCDA